MHDSLLIPPGKRLEANSGEHTLERAVDLMFQILVVAGLESMHQVGRAAKRGCHDVEAA